uniref:hypothetical protein n=1 Tax=Parerythrobacter lutipelagi TaxID=1964208 RepID=UPI0010F61BFB|nr:hypothetical protein [Parerythrobacter lutipelagi]
MATPKKTSSGTSKTAKNGAAAKKTRARKAASGKKAPTKKQTEEPDIPYGVLVGWATDDLGNRLRLRMQSTRSTPKSPEDIEEYHYYIDKDQAVLLGNFLFRVSGHTAPKPSKPAWLRKLLGQA